MCATQFNSCCAKLSASFLLNYGPRRPELNSVDYKIQGVYSSVNMNFKSTKLKKSGKAVIRHLSEKMQIFVFLYFAR